MGSLTAGDVIAIASGMGGLMFWLYFLDSMHRLWTPTYYEPTTNLNLDSQFAIENVVSDLVDCSNGSNFGNLEPVQELGSADGYYRGGDVDTIASGSYCASSTFEPMMVDSPASELEFTSIYPQQFYGAWGLSLADSEHPISNTPFETTSPPTFQEPPMVPEHGGYCNNE